MRFSITFNRVFGVVIAFVLICCALIGGTLSWQSLNQTARNDLSGEMPTHNIVLQKFEKTHEGVITDKLIPGAEFYLYRITDSGEVQIGGRYITDINGQIPVYGLAPGRYVFVETNPGPMHTFDKDSSDNWITRYEFTITEDDEDTIIVKAYNRRIEGSVWVKKIVENADGSPLTDEEINMLFEFNVVFSDGEEYLYSVDGGELQYLVDGKLYLKHGQTAEFIGVPSGVTYTVTETVPSALTGGNTGYWTVTADYYRGTIDEDGIHAVFTNVWHEDTPELTDIIVRKVVQGEISDDLVDKEYHFTILIDGVPHEFTLKDGETISFEDLPVGTVYEVIEDDYSSEGFLQQIINGWGVVGGGTIEVIQYNKFIDIPEIIIEGEKTWDLQGHNPKLPASIKVYLMNGNTVVETAIVIPDKNGKWVYSWKAPKYDVNGVEIVYTVKEDPIPSFRPVIDGYDIKNVYIPPVLVDPPFIEKIVTGDTPDDLPVFAFRIEGQNGAPMPEGSVSGVKTVSLIGDGEVELGEIAYNKAGVYVYTITEINSGVDGWTYDASVYTMTVTVVEKNGVLVVESQTIVKNGDLVEDIVFTNDYDSTLPPPEMVVIQGYKVWEHGDNPVENRPKSIIIYVKNGDVIVWQRQITANDNWEWSFTLPKYDKEDNEIHYTIEELEIDGYETIVDGYNVINHYKPSNPGEEPGTSPGIVPTGDSYDISALAALLGISGLSLIGLIIAMMRRKRFKEDE